MAGKNVVSKLADMKIKEVPGTVWGHIRDNVSWESYHSTRARMSSFLKDYTAKYIDTGSPRPLFDVMGILFVTSYVIAYPQELKHYRAEMQAKLDAELGKEPAAHH